MCKFAMFLDIIQPDIFTFKRMSAVYPMIP